MIPFSKIYQRKDIVTGMLIYGVGDTIAALLSGEFFLLRTLGMSVVGALIYGAEIPHYFRWVDKRTQDHKDQKEHLKSSERKRKNFPLLRQPWKRALHRTLLATLYFNPLWVMRHLVFIALFSGVVDSVSLSLFYVALHSFLIAIPITATANLFIQNIIPLTYRFMASAVFSCSMAIYYPLMSSF